MWRVRVLSSPETVAVLQYNCICAIDVGHVVVCALLSIRRLEKGQYQSKLYCITLFNFARKFLCYNCDKTCHLSFWAFFTQSYSTLHLLQNTFYRIKISYF